MITKHLFNDTWQRYFIDLFYFYNMPRGCPYTYWIVVPVITLAILDKVKRFNWHNHQNRPTRLIPWEELRSKRTYIQTDESLYIAQSGSSSFKPQKPCQVFIPIYAFMISIYRVLIVLFIWHPPLHTLLYDYSQDNSLMTFLLFGRDGGTIANSSQQTTLRPFYRPRQQVLIPW